MNIKLYYIAAAAAAGLLIIGSLAVHLRSNYKIRQLDQAVENAKTEASVKQAAAANAQHAAAEYKQKIEYLESNLGKMRELAQQQDEELEKLNTDTDGARRDVRHARSIRSITVTNEELCAKLAEIGHPCGER